MCQRYSITLQNCATSSALINQNIPIFRKNLTTIWTPYEPNFRVHLTGHVPPLSVVISLQKLSLYSAKFDENVLKHASLHTNLNLIYDSITELQQEQHSIEHWMPTGYIVFHKIIKE